MTEHELFDSFAARSEKRGSEYYFDRETALDFIQTCDEHDVAVIGIECVRLTPHATVPEPSLIADYSSRSNAIGWQAFKDRNNRNARDFVHDAPDGVFFNFAVGTSTW